MLLFSLREAWRSFKHHRGLGYTAIFSLAAALTLCGVFVLLAHGVRVAASQVGDRREMVVYLRDEVTPDERNAIVARLGQLYGQATYVSKEQAWREFSDQVGDPELLESVSENPLPASVRVKLKPELLHFAAMEEAARQVQAYPEVEDVRYGGEWIKRLDDLGTGLRRGAIIVGIVVALAIVFMMYNTLRLSVMARRPQVEIMSRLGASDGFIATPFVVEAILEALVAGLLALGLVYAIHRAFVAQVVDLTFLPWTWAAVFLGAVVVLAWMAAGLALSRVLRSIGA